MSYGNENGKCMLSRCCSSRRTPQTLPWEMLASRVDVACRNYKFIKFTRAIARRKHIRFCLRQRDLLTNNVWTINEFPRRANKNCRAVKRQRTRERTHNFGNQRWEHHLRACQTVKIVYLSASVARQCEPMKVNGNAVSLSLAPSLFNRLTRSAAEAIRHTLTARK